MPILQKQECHGTRNWQGFPFFSLKHQYEKKTKTKNKTKPKYNHHYPTRSVSIWTGRFLPGQVARVLQSHGKQEVLSQDRKWITVPIQAVHGIPLVSPRCYLPPATSEAWGRGRSEYQVLFPTSGVQSQQRPSPPVTLPPLYTAMSRKSPLILCSPSQKSHFP